MTRRSTTESVEVIRYMVDQRLKARTEIKPVAVRSGPHLDEDTLGAFVESRLGETESLPIISHLVACAACRHTTAQLIRLESQLNVENESVSEQVGESVREDESQNGLSAFLSRIGRSFGSNVDDAVFAYQSPAEDGKSTEQSTPTKEEEPGSQNKIENIGTDQ
jgi:hypothetical protein